MSLRHVFQIPLPNSEYAIVLVVCFVYIFVKILRSCHVLTKKNVYWKTDNEKTFAGRKSYVDIPFQIC